MTVDTSVSELLKEVTRVRRDLHKMPEPCYQERKTQAYIWNYLSKLAPDSVEKIADTGVKAIFYCDFPRRTVAFRADIDGLALTELNQCEYTSEHVGYMHACGHDGHTALLLVFAKYISEHRDELTDNVVLLFQPAEEGSGGAVRMIEEGALDNPKVDMLFGLHLWPDVPKGSIGLREGPTMAQTSEIDITITGKSAHGASPHKGIDAIVVAADFVQAMQTVVTRSINPYEKALITIGKITGGESRNILPEKVVMQGTVRTFNSKVYADIEERIKALLSGIEAGYGVTTEFKQVMHYPVLNNPVFLTEYLAEILGYEDIVVLDEIMAAEDFSFYQQKVPGVFFFLGIGDDEKGAHPLHSNLFDFDETALLNGLEIYRRILGLGQQEDKT